MNESPRLLLVKLYSTDILRNYEKNRKPEEESRTRNTPHLCYRARQQTFWSQRLSYNIRTTGKRYFTRTGLCQTVSIDALARLLSFLQKCHPQAQLLVD